MKRPANETHRMRDLFLYMGIGVLVASTAILLGIYQAETGQKPGASLKWVGFAILTLLVFWWAIRGYRPFWANARFWWFLTLFAVVHIASGIAVLLRITMTSLAPFILIAVVESFSLSAYLDLFAIRKH
jgi:hypothetical protein